VLYLLYTKSLDFTLFAGRRRQEGLEFDVVKIYEHRFSLLRIPGADSFTQTPLFRPPAVLSGRTPDRRAAGLAPHG